LARHTMEAKTFKMINSEKKNNVLVSPYI
jgi:hypothetical protein